MSEGLLATVYAPPRARAPWRLEQFLPGFEVRYFSFGRRALAAGLKAVLGSSPRTVLLPELICGDLLCALAAAGASPVFYRVGPDLRPAEGPERWPSAGAVLAVDYFGFPQDLSLFQAYAARTGAVLIEDNAHGLFSRDESGAFLGSRADLGLFSLRKTLPIPDGGALVFRKDDERLRALPQDAFRGPGGLRAALKSALRPLALPLGARRFHGMLSALRGARVPGAGSESALPSPEAPCGLLASPIAAADPETEVSRRRALYLLLESRLRLEGFEPVFASLPANTAPYAFPFRVKEADQERARRALAAQGLEPLPWPDLPCALAARAPAHHRDIRLAHFLW